MPVNPPRTINGVYEALPAEQRETFMREVGETPSTMLPALIDTWRGIAATLAMPDIHEILTAPVDVRSAPEAQEYVDRGAA